MHVDLALDGTALGVVPPVLGRGVRGRVAPQLGRPRGPELDRRLGELAAGLAHRVLRVLEGGRRGRREGRAGRRKAQRLAKDCHRRESGGRERSGLFFFHLDMLWGDGPARPGVGGETPPRHINFLNELKHTRTHPPSARTVTEGKTTENREAPPPRPESKRPQCRNTCSCNHPTT